MPAPPLDPESPLGRVLHKARDLAQEVRGITERAHAEVKESYRLTALARRHSERGRQLSQISREEARAVHRSINWSLDTTLKAGRRLSGKDEG